MGGRKGKGRIRTIEKNVIIISISLFFFSNFALYNSFFKKKKISVVRFTKIYENWEAHVTAHKLCTVHNTFSIFNFFTNLTFLTFYQDVS